MIRSLSMHPDICYKLMSMHLKSDVNASRSELLFRSKHQTDTGISQNQPSWTLPLLLLTKLLRQLNQSMYIMWDIRRVVLATACVVHPKGCIGICQCILDSYPCFGLPFTDTVYPKREFTYIETYYTIFDGLSARCVYYLLYRSWAFAN